MKSLRERDAHLINNWYVACTSEELLSDPIQRIIYEKPFVLFRSSGKAVCLLDRCLHRHALLSEGTVKKSHLICPYHGWEYNQNGQVVHVPSEESGTNPAGHLCSKNLPCIEQDGYIWIWPGEASKATASPPWRLPFYENSGWTNYVMITDFENEVTNLAENFMDVPHTVYVHHGWFRDEKATRKKIPMSVETNQGRVLVTYHQKEDELSFMARLVLNPKGAPMKHTDEFIFPNLTRVDYWFGADYGFIINSQITPVGAMQSRVYTYITYKIPYLNKLLKPVVQFYTRKVITQDVLIMQNQGKSLLFDPTTNFRSTPADELHIQVERLRDMGMQDNVDLFKLTYKKDANFWI